MRKTLIFFVLLVNVQLIKCQVEYGGKPYSQKYGISFNNITSNTLPEIIVPNDTSGLSFVGPLRKINADILSKGTTIVMDSDIIILYKVKSTGAKSMYLVFDKFILSNNTRVFFHYGENKIKGCYKNLNVLKIKDKKFAGPIIPGDECIIEINQKKIDIENEIVLNSIAHFLFADYKMSKTSSTYSSCNIDVNCPEGDSWCNQIRSVAHYYFPKSDGIYQCSGALINNYKQDFTPYFYTAYHCANDVSDFSTTKFVFDYQFPECGTGDALEMYSVNGSELLSYCDVAGSDNALLKINEDIPAQFNVYFSGFDVHARNFYDDVHCIHHSAPSGFNPTKYITHGQIQFFVGPRWDVYWFDGALFGGGSGAPVFLDANKRIIANLHGGYSYDCDSHDKHDFVGKLRSCFRYAGMADLLNHGIDGIGGVDPLLACQKHLDLYGFFYDARFYRYAKHDILIQAEESIDVSSIASSEFLSNAWYNIQAGKSIALHAGTSLEYGSKVHLYIASCVSTEDECGINYTANKTIQNTNLFGDDELINFNLYPNPASSQCTVRFIIPESADVTITLSDMTGREVGTIDHSWHTQGTSFVPFSTESYAPGLYLVRYSDGTHTSTQRLTIAARN